MLLRRTPLVAVRVLRRRAGAVPGGARQSTLLPGASGKAEIRLPIRLLPGEESCSHEKGAGVSPKRHCVSTRAAQMGVCGRTDPADGVADCVLVFSLNF